MADIDIKGPSHSDRKRYAPDQDAALAIVRDLPLAPTVVVHSGGGLHVWWLLREPWVFGDDAERESARSLAHGWGAVVRTTADRHGCDVDAVHDLARVLRVPGTLNHKDPDAPKPVRIIEFEPDLRYEPADFGPFAAAVSPKAERATLPTVSVDLHVSDEEAAALRTRLEGLLSADPDLRGQWERTADRPDQSASGYADGVAQRLARNHRWTAPEVAWAVTEFYTTQSQPGDHELHPAKLQRTVARAIASDPPAITTNRQLRDVADDVLGALQAANEPPVLFVRTGALVRLVRDEHDRATIGEVGVDSLRGRMAEVGTFMQVTAKGTRNVYPPDPVARTVLARGEWPFPPLERVVEMAVLRPDWTVLDRPGYDSATRLYYAPEPGTAAPDVPERPTADQVAAARDLLLETVCDFPFVDDASRANVLGLLLTPAIRPALHGNVPLALIDAPQAGTGKGLIAEVVSTITTGRPSAMLTTPSTEDEWRKRITAILHMGATIVTIDNVEECLGSASLASAITARVWKDRVLGRTEAVEIPQRATWLATGNNLLLRGDMARRCFWIRMDAETARPWQRDGFRHPDLLRWVAQNRARLITALLTLARAWHVAERPAADVPKLGGFEEWAAVVSGILAHAGVPSFLGNLDSLYDKADDDAAEWELFLKAWLALFGGTPVTAGETACTWPRRAYPARRSAGSRTVRSRCRSTSPTTSRSWPQSTEGRTGGPARARRRPRAEGRRGVWGLRGVSLNPTRGEMGVNLYGRG